jgi:hypothetical protein
MSNVTEKLISHVVQDFDSVEIVRGLTCPTCRVQLGPHALRHDGVTVTVRCDNCHCDVISCEPVAMEREPA